MLFTYHFGYFQVLETLRPPDKGPDKKTVELKRSILVVDVVMFFHDRGLDHFVMDWWSAGRRAITSGITVPVAAAAANTLPSVRSPRPLSLESKFQAKWSMACFRDLVARIECSP